MSSQLPLPVSPVWDGVKASGTSSLLRLENVEVTYNQGAVLALRGVSLHAVTGAITAVLGPNGAGKTTMLRACSGLLPVNDGEISKGRIRYEGEVINAHSARTLVTRGIAHTLEGRRLFPNLTVIENLRLGIAARRSRRNSDEFRDLVAEMCGIFPRIADKLNLQAGLLSGGEQQMVALARGLISRPRLLMLDEPTLGLAPGLLPEISRLLGTIRAKGTSVLLIEQNAELALSLADYGYIVERGRIVLEGSAEELRSNADVQEFYLGTVQGEDRKSFHDIKHYRRKKRWL